MTGRIEGFEVARLKRNSGRAVLRRGPDNGQCGDFADVVFPLAKQFMHWTQRRDR
jgi:hypothetical protein